MLILIYPVKDWNYREFKTHGTVNFFIILIVMYEFQEIVSLMFR